MTFSGIHKSVVESNGMKYKKTFIKIKKNIKRIPSE